MLTGWGVALEALGLEKSVRKALSAARMKVSAFIGNSLALLLYPSNNKPFILVIFFANGPDLWCNRPNFPNGGWLRVSVVCKYANT